MHLEQSSAAAVEARLNRKVRGPVLYSIVLLPLLIAIFSNGEGGGPVREEEIIKLEFPAERRKRQADYSGLTGTVTDKMSKKPIAGAEVSIPELELRCNSDKNGRFSLRGIKSREKNYEILISCPGYKALFADSVFKAGKILDFNYTLTPVAW